jgi:hypothetical protein
MKTNLVLILLVILTACSNLEDNNSNAILENNVANSLSNLIDIIADPLKEINNLQPLEHRLINYLEESGYSCDEISCIKSSDEKDSIREVYTFSEFDLNDMVYTNFVMSSTDSLITVIETYISIPDGISTYKIQGISKNSLRNSTYSIMRNLRDGSHEVHLESGSQFQAFSEESLIFHLDVMEMLIRDMITETSGLTLEKFIEKTINGN